MGTQETLEQDCAALLEGIARRLCMELDDLSQRRVSPEGTEPVSKEGMKQLAELVSMTKALVQLLRELRGGQESEGGRIELSGEVEGYAG